MTTTTDLTPEQKIATLRHLAGGKGLDVVTTIMRADRATVLDLASKHGYPDREKLGWAADILAKKAAETDAPTEHPQARDIVRQDRRPQSVVVGDSTPSPTTPLTRPDEIRVLINTAKGHDSKRIQAAGDRVLAAVDRLKELLAEDQEKHAEKRRAAAAKAAARAEVEKLEEQLAAAKAKLRGKPAPKRASTAPKGDYPCRNDGCDKHYDTPQGRSLHERMKCEHREAAAS